MATAAGRRGSGERGRREGAPGSATSGDERSAFRSSPMRGDGHSAFGIWAAVGHQHLLPQASTDPILESGRRVGIDISDLGQRMSRVLKFSSDFSAFLWEIDR